VNKDRIKYAIILIVMVAILCGVLYYFLNPTKHVAMCGSVVYRPHPQLEEYSPDVQVWAIYDGDFVYYLRLDGRFKFDSGYSNRYICVEGEMTTEKSWDGTKEYKIIDIKEFDIR